MRGESRWFRTEETPHDMPGLVPVSIHEWEIVNRLVGNPSAKAARRQKAQAAWRRRNPDYFIARRIPSYSEYSRVSRCLASQPVQ